MENRGRMHRKQETENIYTQLVYIFCTQDGVKYHSNETRRTTYDNIN